MSCTARGVLPRREVVKVLRAGRSILQENIGQSNSISEEAPCYHYSWFHSRTCTRMSLSWRSSGFALHRRTRSVRVGDRAVRRGGKTITFRVVEAGHSNKHPEESCQRLARRRDVPRRNSILQIAHSRKRPCRIRTAKEIIGVSRTPIFDLPERWSNLLASLESARGSCRSVLKRDHLRRQRRSLLATS